jgi:hypothetical protein
MHSTSDTKVRDRRSQIGDRHPTTKPVPERAAGEIQVLLRLQRLAGNEAITQLVAQRADVLDALSEPQTPPRQAQVGQGPKQPLSKDDRDFLDKDARSNLDQCFTNFTKAITDEQLAERAEAADRAEMIALVFDIATGFLAPGVGKFLGHAVERAGEKLENKAFKAALKFMSEERLKTVFESAVKVGSNVMKDKYAALSGETDADAFMTQTIVQFQLGIDTIRDNLRGMTDEELIVIVAAYDRSVANLNTYRAAVHELLEKFDKQVHPIGESASFDMEVVERSANYAYYIVTSLGPRLALVHVREPDYSEGTTDYTFRTWISKEMAGPAFAKMQQYGGIKILKRELVDHLPS